MRTILPHAENPTLRAIAREIPQSKITSAPVHGLIAELKALLAKEEYGVALAAPQVGEALRLFVVSGKALTKRERSNARRGAAAEKTPEMPMTDEVYINPAIIKISRGKTDKHEGCLSVRGFWGMVPRAEKITLRYLDESGAPRERGAAGLLAHIFQHEMDHLDGILYVDKATAVYEEKEDIK